MEDTLQRVFSILISVIILFLLPLYIAFEKMDDISYSMALKITTNFVDNVTSKGYMSKEMYNDFISQLAITGNSYDVKIEHVSKKYNPAYYIYDDAGNITKVLDYSLYYQTINNGNDNVTIDGTTYRKDKIKLSYSTSKVKYTDKQILEFLDNNDGHQPCISVDQSKYKSIDYSKWLDTQVIKYTYPNYDMDGNVDNNNKIYTMNKGDEFNVRVKNENVTVATVLFNAFTLGIGGTENNTRVYVNYGGTIDQEEYKNLQNSTE